jgi:hypothetical protein
MNPVRFISLRGVTILAVTLALLLQPIPISAAVPPLFELTLALDGVDDYASAPDSVSLDLGIGADEDFTIEGWFYVPDLTNTTNDTLVWKNGAYGLFILYSTTQPDRFIFRVYTGTGSPGYVYIYYDVDLDVRWHHVAAVFDNENTPSGDQLILFLDGQRVYIGTGFDVSGIPNSTSALNLGGYGSTNPAVGWMEEVRLSDTVRYSGSTYTEPTTPLSSDANTLSLYHFNETWGATTFADSSGNGNTLTGVNGAQIGNPLGHIPPPLDFSKTSPSNSSHPKQPLSLTLSWETNPQAYDGYDYCVDTTNNNLCDGSWLPTTDTQVALSGLTRSTGYFWQVRARYAGVTTEANEGFWWYFETIPYPPPAFSKVQPANGAVNRPVNGLEFLWNSTSDGSPYEYCLDTVDDSLCATSWTTTGTDPWVTLDGLEYATTYYYQVRAVNLGGETYANDGTWWSFTTQPEAPAAFGKTAPVDGAIDQPGVVHLSWEPSSRADYYQYCYDMSIGDDCNSTWTSTGTDTSVDLNIGIGSSAYTYYWQVRAINGGGATYANNGTYWSFTTVPPPPGDLFKVTPYNETTNLPASLTLSWSEATLAVGYEYCIDTLNNDSCDEIWTPTGTDTSIVLSDLDVTTTYYWQVRATNTGGINHADRGTWWSFTTVPLPGIFGKAYPFDDGTGVEKNDNLDWFADSSNATGYEVCYDKVDNDICDASWILRDQPNQDSFLYITNLDPNTIYFWQVRAVNSMGLTYADAGTWWSFTTGTAPGVFGKSSPSNAAVNQPYDPNLVWNGSLGTADYEVCFDTSDDNACSGWTSAGYSGQHLTSLNPYTTYYWQARAINSFGTTYANGSSTSYWSFTTGGLPGAFEKIDPHDGTAGVPLNPLLAWAASTHAGWYDYCYDTTDDNDCSEWVDNHTSTSVQLSGLNPNTTYYWQVRAVTNVGSVYADGGTWWSFTTIYQVFLPLVIR